VLNKKAFKILNNNWVQFFLFAGLIWLIFVNLHINRHIEDMIIGPHYWRKSDTYAQIMNYYYNGLNFFDHGIYFNQMDSNAKAVAEFPLVYWFMALQLKVFGQSYLLLKINWIILLIIGLFSLFKIAQFYLKNVFLSIAVATVIFMSTVFSFYSIDFLPDSLAINFMWIGLWILLKYHKSLKIRHLILSMILLSICGMLKPFFLIPYLAFLSTVLVAKMFKVNNHLNFKWQYSLPLIFVSLWFLYTNWYNNSVGSDYFLSQARPIWNYNAVEIERVWHRITDIWLKLYLNENFLWPFIVLIVLNLIWWTKSNIMVSVFYLFSVLGSLAFVFLFFNMFDHHDYYIFPILFLLPLTLGVFFLKLKSILKHQILVYSVGFLVMLSIYFGLDNTWSLLQNRIKVSLSNSKFEFENYQNLDYFLNKNKITSNDFVITFTDKSPSFALSLLNRKGWSGHQLKAGYTSIQSFINLGANYLIVNKRVPVSDKDILKTQEFLDYPIADTNDIYIYNLKPYRHHE